jgi:hypothetical protein
LHFFSFATWPIYFIHDIADLFERKYIEQRNEAERLRFYMSKYRVGDMSLLEVVEKDMLEHKK